MDDGKSLTVVAVGVGSYGVLQHVALEVRLLAQLQQAVFGKGRVPHQLSAGKVVIGIDDEGTQVSDDIAHHSLVDPVGDVVPLRTAHIGLHAVAQSIESPAYHLLHRNSSCQVAVKNGERVIRPDKRLFQFLFRIGDDRPVVLLGASARRSDYGTRRHELRRKAVLFVHHVPDVPVCPRLRRHYLAAVDDRPAAYGQDEVDTLLADDARALLHFPVGGVGQDASEIRHSLAALAQPAGDFVIQSRAPQRAAAIGQQHVPSHTGHFFLDRALGAPLAEVLADGVLVSKIIHLCRI